MIIMEVDKFVKKEILAMGGGSLTRSMPPIPPNAINLLAGDPDFNQPEFISRAVYDAMKEGHTHYAFGGDPAFKAAIADYYGKYVVEHFPVLDVLRASLVSFLCGSLLSVVAAIAPAYMAARKQPVDAMRVVE